MYFRLMGKLNARRKGLLEEDEKGFTLIELLVVVIIIGILAAIAIPVYIGIQNNAKDAAVKNDLSNWKTALVAVYTNNPSASFPTVGALPATTAVAYGTTSWSALGATSSANYTGGQALTTLTGSGFTNFCIDAKSGETGNFFHIDSKAGVGNGQCSTLPGN